MGKPVCLVVDHNGWPVVVAVFREGDYPDNSSIRITDPLESAKRKALSLAQDNPSGIYEVYVCDSVVDLKPVLRKMDEVNN